MKIAIIGSGMSAITLAKHLKKDNFITLFEKSRSVGGRISTRRSEKYEFDHGAQFFTAKSKDFKNFIAPIIKKNIIQRWDARFAEFKNNVILRQHNWDSEYPHYVGAPGMSNILKYLSDDLNIELNTEIHNVTKNNNIDKTIKGFLEKKISSLLHVKVSSDHNVIDHTKKYLNSSYSFKKKEII